MSYKIITAVVVLALASMACGFSIDLPKRAEPGPDVTDTITVATPESGDAQLKISFGAGKLSLEPGAEGKLVDGTATYNLADLKPVVKEDGSNVEILQGEYHFDSVVTLNKIKNDWQLKLGDTPMDLTIEAGAYDGHMELGGLSLKSLTVKDGAANAKLSFGSANPEEMSVLRYETGASNVTLTGLGNANFNTMIFKSGAGNYDLDFSGKLQRDATVSISCGLSDLTLRIPKGVHAVVNTEGGPQNISASSSWSQNGNTYTQDGDGSTLTFIVDVGAGNLTLTD